MRDIFFTLVLIGVVRFILYRPFFGVLAWAWVSYFSPQALVWGFAKNIQFAMIVGIVVIISFVFSKESKRIPWSPIIVVLIVFNLWMLLTTILSVYPDVAWMQLEKVFKIQLMTLITIIVVNTRERLQWLLFVIVFSVGFWVIKGGVFAILSGGRYLVHGPEGTFLDGNNTIGLTAAMLIPLLYYLQFEDQRRWAKHGIRVLMFLCTLTIVASYSRGAVLAGLAMSMSLWWKSRNKILIILVTILIGIILINFMPDRWSNRMDTIQNYEQEASALGRINAWWFSWNFALHHPITGGGFGIETPELFLLYAPVPDDFHVAHSIYFSVLAQQGFVGFFLWALVWFLALKTGIRVEKLSQHTPSLIWSKQLSNMIRVSLIGYFVGGAFLNLANWDLVFHLLAMLVILERIVQDQITARQQNDFPSSSAQFEKRWTKRDSSNRFPIKQASVSASSRRSATLDK